MRAHAVLVAATLASACSRGAPPAPPAAPRTAPLAPDGSAARAVTSIPDRVKVELDLATVRAALRAHHAERGAWPGALGELQVQGLSYPTDLVYDPAAGTVQSRTYPGL